MGPVGSKVIEYRGQRSNLCFFLFVPLLLPGPWADLKFYGFFSVCSPTSPRSLGQSSPNLLGRLRAALEVSSRGSFFLKVKVIEVKGKISLSRQSLVRFA